MANAFLIRMVIVQGIHGQIVDVYMGEVKAELHALLLMLESSPTVTSFGVFNTLAVPHKPLTQSDLGLEQTLRKFR